MVRLAQLVRASDCGSEGRGFETHISPLKNRDAAYTMQHPCFCRHHMMMYVCHREERIIVATIITNRIINYDTYQHG